MRAFLIQLQISPFSSAISKPNQAKLMIYNLGENCQCNELPMQNKWKLTLSLVSCYHGRNLVRDTGDVSPHFFRRGDIKCHVRPTFFSLGFVFGEVSKIKVMFVTFCVKSFSCWMVGHTYPSWCWNRVWCATITGPSFSAGILRDRLPGSAPISLQWFKLVLIIHQCL